MRRGKDGNRTRIILLRGNYAEANFGDDALLLAAHCLMVRYADRILVDGSVTYRDSRLGRLEERTRNQRCFDAIIYGGGTQFFAFDHDAPPKRDSIGRRILGKIVHPARVFESIRARHRVWIEAQAPRLAIGFGIGPFPKNSPVEAAVARIVRAMDLVWVRDAASEDFCRRHGVDTAIRSADLCFTRAFAEAVTPPTQLVRSEGSPRRVGIVLRDWKALDNRFFDIAIEVARRLRQRHVTVIFFSFSPEDHRLRAMMLNHGETMVNWGDDNCPLETFWAKLAWTDLIVTARFHGAVFALLSETPFLAITIEPKLTLLQDWAPAAHDLTVSPELDAEAMTRRILSVLEELPLRKAATRDMLEEQRRLAEIGEKRLGEFFELGPEV